VAPSRIELPTQSAPVSPPPMTITFLPLALIEVSPVRVGSDTQRLRT
jgi:hypothetical protein